MTTPLVSIILPAHNAARTIRQAIESVRRQTYTNWELIIINDGSTDATGALVTEIAAVESRIRSILFSQNKGIQRALNEGLLQAKGEYLARIDADDVWADVKKLAAQVEYCNSHPDCALLGTGIIVQDTEGNELYRFLNPETDEQIRRTLLYRNCFSHSSVMFRKDAALRFNGYDESERVRHLEDYDLWLKIGTIGSMANLPLYAVRFTSDPATISGRHKLTQLRQQLALVRPFKSRYPGGASATIKAYLRFFLYAGFEKATPQRIKNWILAWYKRV